LSHKRSVFKVIAFLEDKAYTTSDNDDSIYGRPFFFGRPLKPPYDSAFS